MLAFLPRYLTCPLCGSERLKCDFTILLQAGDLLSWDACSDCTLVFQNPQLSKELLAALYSQTNYFGREAGGIPGYYDYAKADALRIAQSKRRLQRIARITGIRKGRLLDVGSATGFFGYAAKQRGFDVTCIEPDQQLAELGSKRYGLAFMAKPLESCSLPRERYDLVTIWGSDSDLLHPLDSFQQMADALRPGGALALTYQDFSHWLRMLIPSIKQRWNAMFNQTDRSFEVLAQKLGMTIVVENEWQTVTIDHICRHLSLPRLPFGARIPVRVPAVSFRFAILQKSTDR